MACPHREFPRGPHTLLVCTAQTGPFPGHSGRRSPRIRQGARRASWGTMRGTSSSRTRHADPRVGPRPAVAVRPLLRDRAPAAHLRTAVSVSQPTFLNSSQNESAQGVLRPRTLPAQKAPVARSGWQMIKFIGSEMLIQMDKRSLQQISR